MTYGPTVDKISRTIDTCTKVEQLVMAKKYSHMLVSAYVKEYKSKHGGTCTFAVHFEVLNIIDELTARIKRLCDEWVINNEPMLKIANKNH